MVSILASEYERLVAVEEAARWHLANSACRGWQQGEVLALALGLNPDEPVRQFRRLLRQLGIDAPHDPLSDVLDAEGPTS